MTENNSDGNAGKKQKGQCNLSLYHASSASFFENIARHGDGGGDDRLLQHAILGKNIYEAVFGSVLAKLKKKTRSVRRRALSK